MTDAESNSSKLSLWLKVMIIGGALAIFLIAGARLMLARIIASEEFRHQTASFIESALHSVIPRPLVRIETSELKGFTTVILRDINIRGSVHVEHAIDLKKMTMKPVFASLFGSSPLKAHIAVEVAGGGGGEIDIQVPRGLLRTRSHSQTTGIVELVGQARQLDTAKLGALILGENGIERLIVTQGVTRLGFSLSQAVGVQSGQGWKRRGQIELTTEDLTLKPTDNEKKAVALPPLSMALLVEDYELALKEPVVLPDPHGHAWIEGKIMMPERLDSGPQWHLVVAIKDEPDFASALGRVLGCVVPPSSKRYSVDGPVNHSDCKEAPLKW